MPDCYLVRKQYCNWVQTYQLQCTQTYQQNVSVCTQTQTTGYNSCTQTANQGYSACSGWGGWLSWVCIAWTWISNVVCVAWTWISNVVCIAWQIVQYAGCLTWSVITGWKCVLAWAYYLVCVTPQVLTNLGLAIGAWLENWIRCRDPKDMPRNPIEKPGWILTFQDDFNQAAVDYTKWKDHTWWGARYFDAPSGSQPQVYLQTGYYPSGNFDFGPSTIKLLSNNQPVAVFDPKYGGNISIPYTGAWLESLAAFDQIEGYFEIRCKTPGASEMWPAFWLASRHSWPPEIDVFEFYTNDNDRFESTLHWGKDPNHPKATAGHPVCRASEFFHIYACEWTKTEIRWYYDNKLIRIESNGLSDFIHPMMVILSTGPDTRSGHYPQSSSYPNAFEVDYVRAYRR